MKKKKANKFNTTKFDKVIKIKSNHGLCFELGSDLKVDGHDYTVVNVLFDKKKTFFVYLNFKD